jgi:hypothetical protein
MKPLVILPVLIAAFAAVLPANAKLLQGHLEETGQPQKTTMPAFQVEQAQIDNRRIKEYCSCMQPTQVKVEQIAGQWALTNAQSQPLISFGVNADAAMEALHVIKTYGLNQTCTLSKGSSTYQLHYFLKDDEAPQGPMDGEDAIAVNGAPIRAEQINGSWKVTSGPIWMLDFGPDQQSAQQAAEALQYHGFTHHCFVGKPSRSLMYFRK